MSAQVEPGLAQAVALAKRAVAEGHAIRYTVAEGRVDVESDQGWQTWWPEDIHYNPQANL